MIELVTVIAILAVLMLLLWLNVPKYLSKGRDARRKSDLHAFKIAFEEYMNDYKKYPDTGIFVPANCNSAVLQPYMQKFPCDPLTKQPYTYTTTDTIYTVTTTLEDTTDPVIASVGCSAGCGTSATGEKRNYGISSTFLSRTGISPTPTPTSGTTATSTPAPSTETVILMKLGNFNDPNHRCNVGGCGGGYWCDTGYRCGSNQIYCYQDPTCL